LFRNDGRYTKYDGVEISARKRLSHRYMLSGSIVYNHEREFLEQPDRDYLDPTNVAVMSGREGGSTVYSATTLPSSANLRNIPWVGKLGGMYQFPWDISAAANFIGQSGSPLNPYVLSPTRRAQLGTVNVFLQPNNSFRYDNYYQLDLHAHKAGRIRGPRRGTLNVHGVNVFKHNLRLGQ